MNELLFAIGLTVVFLGLLLIMGGLLLELNKKKQNEKEENKQNEERTEYGGVIFIGPIPIVFGSSKKIARVMLIIGVIIFVLFLIFTLITYL
ncbi:DUF131 domain-containing protein [Sulfurisphaera javensis]|uniref:DUF131 domain-containing protein n=1 Tax=Sulfurisphaera javensis TaxID=2049879 RepID=A0AAT9GP77_9CREN